MQVYTVKYIMNMYIQQNFYTYVVTTVTYILVGGNPSIFSYLHYFMLQHHTIDLELLLVNLALEILDFRWALLLG